jgi:rhodanese-related sulfurtransferase
MGASQSINKINFEDMQYMINSQPEKYILINTLHENDQDCLIVSTITATVEVDLLTNVMNRGNKSIKIIVYGRNCNDDKIHKKYTDLVSLGFSNVYVYPGGLFEWLLLQDIYGPIEFPTTKKELDILKYKPVKVFNVQLLGYM